MSNTSLDMRPPTTGATTRPGTRAGGHPIPLLKDTPAHQIGLLPRAIHTLLQKIKSREHRWKTKLSVSFMQIYREQIFDLLSPPPGPLVADDGSLNHQGLKLRWNKNDYFVVDKLEQIECTEEKQIVELMHKGLKHKVMGSHRLNHVSSRSHTIFRISIETVDSAKPDDTLTSVLQFADLAGSEKTKLTQGQSIKETIEINKSLLVLRQVILKLSDQYSRGQQVDKICIPYRETKLTSLLQQSLGGNSYTIMIACIAPSDQYNQQNLSTLTYASKAAYICNSPIKNEDPKSRMISELRSQVQLLTLELGKANDYIRFMSHVLSPEEGKVREVPNPLEFEEQKGEKGELKGEKGEQKAGQTPRKQNRVTINNDYSSNVVTVICRPTSSAPSAQQQTQKLEPFKLKRNSTVQGHLKQCDLCRQQAKDIDAKLHETHHMVREVINYNLRLRKNVDELSIKTDNQAMQLYQLHSENQEMREKLHRVGEAAATITSDMFGINGAQLERRSYSIRKGDKNGSGVPPHSHLPFYQQESMGSEPRKKLSSLNPMNHTFYSDYNSDIVSGGGVLSGDSRTTSEINLKQAQQKPRMQIALEEIKQKPRKKTGDGISSSAIEPGDSASIRIFSGDGIFKPDPNNEAHWVMEGSNAEDFTGFQNISSQLGIRSPTRGISAGGLTNSTLRRIGSPNAVNPMIPPDSREAGSIVKSSYPTEYGGAFYPAARSFKFSSGITSREQIASARPMKERYKQIEKKGISTFRDKGVAPQEGKSAIIEQGQPKRPVFPQRVQEQDKANLDREEPQRSSGNVPMTPPKPYFPDLNEPSLNQSIRYESARRPPISNQHMPRNDSRNVSNPRAKPEQRGTSRFASSGRPHREQASISKKRNSHSNDRHHSVQPRKVVILGQGHKGQPQKGQYLSKSKIQQHSFKGNLSQTINPDIRPQPSYSKKRNSISSDANSTSMQSSIGNTKSILQTAKRMEQDEIKSVKIRFQSSPAPVQRPSANILPASRHVGGFGSYSSNQKPNSETLHNSTTPRFLGTLNLDHSEQDEHSALQNYRVIDGIARHNNHRSPKSHSPESILTPKQSERTSGSRFVVEGGNQPKSPPVVLAASSALSDSLSLKIREKVGMSPAGLPVIEEKTRHQGKAVKGHHD